LGSTQPIQALPAAITPRARNRSVFYAFTGARWITDIKGAFTLDVLVEYLALWDLLSEVTLHSDIDDVHVWQLSTTGQYTAKSAYENLEPLVWALGREFGKAGLRGNASSFCGLLPIIDARQQIDLLKEALTIHQNVHFVIKLKKQ